MDTTTVHCMCTTNSASATINTCVGCMESNPTDTDNADIDGIALAAWVTTCKADGQFGEQQAALCWQSQPTDYMPCVEKTGGKSDLPTGAAGSGLTTSATSLGTR